MKHCAMPGAEVWLSASDNPQRKYPNTWELTRSPQGHYIGIHAGQANQLVADGIRSGVITELQGYAVLKSEVQYGNENSRIDLLLYGPHKQDCYVEVKSVTLLELPVTSGRGYFPDAVSDRGRKHLRELGNMAQQGARAVLVYCVQHSGIKTVAAAEHIDPAYAKALAAAIKLGVEVLAYRCRMSPHGVRIVKPLAVIL